MRLPKFNKPPVVETVLGVQFPEIAAFTNVHFGLFWVMIRERFPRPPQDQPRIAWVDESFPYRPVPSGLNLRLSGSSPQRVWYKSKSESELIQLQPDRFHFNWRLGKGEDYPSFEANRERFLAEYEGFESFCSDQRLEQPKPCLAEVTYVNHLVPRDDESAVSLLQDALVGVEFQSMNAPLGVPERATFNRVFPIGDSKGRLYVEANLAQQRDRTEFVLLKLTSRVSLPEDGSLSFADGLTMAHDWLVAGFAAVARPEIQQERWERTQ